MNLRNSITRHDSKTLTETIRIPTLAGVVHFLKDGDMEFTQHPFPICIFVGARKETIGECDQFVKYDDIETDGGVQVRPLNFNRDFPPIV